MMRTLTIRELSLSVRLGWTAEERATPQEVRVTVEIRFHSRPNGESTDDLGDTLCYDRLCASMREFVAHREFKLVEKLASELFALIQPQVRDQARLALSLHKVNPPIAGLQGGVEYRLEDPA